jgi:hypothetical protein
LAQFFQRNGYIRSQNKKRREELGRDYKKGWEVRLPVADRSELTEVRGLLKALGFKPGKPFRKGKQWIQPIYGQKAVKAFVTWTRRR